MTRKEINDGNRLIAQYLGYEYIPFNNPDHLKPGWWKKNLNELQRFIANKTPSQPHGTYLGRSVKDLNYFNDWDWLMPVVSKIVFEKYGELRLNGSLVILNKGSFIESESVRRHPVGGLNCKPIELIWKLVVDFIKHNNNL